MSRRYIVGLLLQYFFGLAMLAGIGGLFYTWLANMWAVARENPDGCEIWLLVITAVFAMSAFTLMCLFESLRKRIRAWQLGGNKEKEEGLPSAAESLRRGWEDAKAGRTKPLETLWDDDEPTKT